MQYGLYLYGIFPHPCSPVIELEGMDKQPVFTQSIEDFVFVFSEAKQSKYLTSRRNLLCHEKVLEAMMKLGFTNLLPLRFGLVVKDWETVGEQLINPYREKLISLFTKLAGKREVSIKVFWDGEKELEGLMESDDSLRQQRDRLQGRALTMDETIMIGQKIEWGLELRKRAIIQAFEPRLNPLAFEVVEGEILMENMIYNMAYLIGWDKEEKFSEQVEFIDQILGNRLRIRYNNFTAPYTFAQLR